MCTPYAPPRLTVIPKASAASGGAYEALRDTESRLALRLFGPPPLANLEELLDAFPEERRSVGPGPWLKVLREPRR